MTGVTTQIVEEPDHASYELSKAELGFISHLLGPIKRLIVREASRNLML